MGSNSTPMTVARMEDTIKALRLRRAGFTVQDISEALGRPVPAVRSMLKEAMSELGLLKEEEAAGLRLLESDRLDAMMNAIWDRASEGSLVHIAAVIKIMERRAKLLALDMKTEGSGDDDKFVVIPAWAAKAKPEAIETSWEEMQSDTGELGSGSSIPSEGTAPEGGQASSGNQASNE